MKLKIRFYTHFKALESTIYITVLTFVAVFLIGINSNFDEGLFKFFGIYLLVNIAPAIYMHVKYYLCNRGDEYQIRNGEIIQYKNGIEKRLYETDLKSIVIYMSPSVFKGSNSHFLAIESYHYAKIITKKDEEILITSLLTPNVEEAVKQLVNVTYERKKSLFNLPSYQSSKIVSK